MRFGREKVAKVEKLAPAVELDIGDQETETVGTEVAAGKRAVEYHSVGGMANDPLEDFPRQSGGPVG